MGLSRRRVLGSGLTAAGGALAGLAAPVVRRDLGPDRLPLGGGFAPAADRLDLVGTGHIDITWRARTTRRAVALTFDDGPAPNWTPMVLDLLDQAQAPATFFATGQNLDRHGHLYQGRLARHELANHTWSHPDLATLDARAVAAELDRTAEAITAISGQRPTIMRPPYGHLGGAAVLAAQATRHDVVLWSLQAHENTFGRDPAALVADIVDHAWPGDIVLCHDTGGPGRLVTLRHLPLLIDRLRTRGFELVTVSELRAAP